MTASCLKDIVTLGTVTGMRSMSGPAALAFSRTGPLKQIMPLLALGEMLVDKTTFVGDRIDPLPLAGRAVMGGLVGGAVAREYGNHIVGGVLLGSAVAVAAAHIAYRIRARFAEHSALAGTVEDALVAAMAGSYAARASHGAA